VGVASSWSAITKRDALVVILTLVTGSLDAVGFLRLGGVFTSVMTANMVLLGISAARHDAALALHNGTAFGAYVLGVLVGSRVATGTGGEQGVWPRRITVALTVELAVLVVSTTWWEVAGGHPSSTSTYPLLALNALALGVQSAAVLGFREPGLSTTYLTGTLTQLLASISERKRFPRRSLAILVALVSGGALGAVLAIDAPRWAPVAPLGALVLVIVGSASVRWSPGTNQ
jgi:uncharacterized membrane protein YoaK (UPF0700 family)